MSGDNKELVVGQAVDLGGGMSGGRKTLLPVAQAEILPALALIHKMLTEAGARAELTFTLGCDPRMLEIELQGVREGESERRFHVVEISPASRINNRAEIFNLVLLRLNKYFHEEK